LRGKKTVDILGMASIPSITKNDNKTAHEFKAISLHFTTEIIWGFM
jgi:hypothetical protein